MGSRIWTKISNKVVMNFMNSSDPHQPCKKNKGNKKVKEVDGNVLKQKERII